MTDKNETVITRQAYYSNELKAGPSSFNVSVPEIYQIEVTNACNYSCDFCPRDTERMRRANTFIDVELVKLIVERDFEGSYFTEFQLSGEPLLHKQLYEIVSLLKGKVLTGLSTNGSATNNSRNLEALMLIDYVTISIDSVTDYANVRKGGNWDKVLFNLRLLIHEIERRGSGPAVDLQLIEFPGYEKERDLLLEIVNTYNMQDFVTIRTIPDCFQSLTRQHKPSASKEICLNPWLSVTIQADGDVVPCCFAFGKEVVYGNLYNQSLKEIWATSPVLQQLRNDMLTGTYNKLCGDCHMRSPTLLHWDLYTNTVKDRVLTSDSN